MPDVYTSPIPLTFRVSGALTVGITVLRKVVPFDHEVIGVNATVGTAPVGASAIFDLLHGATNTTPVAGGTIWPTNPANRPTILAAAKDQAAIAAGSTTVAPQGTDPPLSGQSAGVSTTYVNYDELPFLAKPDPNSSGYGFGARAGGVGEPFNEGNQPSVLGTPGVPQAPQPSIFLGAAGDVYLLSIIAIGTTPAADAEIVMWVDKR